MDIGRTVIGGAGVAIVGYLLWAGPAQAADPLPLPVPAGLPTVPRVAPVAPLVAAVLAPVRDSPVAPVLHQAPRVVAPLSRPPVAVSRAARAVPPPRRRLATTVTRQHPSRHAVGFPVPTRAPAPATPAPAGPVPGVPLWWPVYPFAAPATGAGPDIGTPHDVTPVRMSGSLAPDVPRTGGTAAPDRPHLPRGPPRLPAFRPD